MGYEYELFTEKESTRKTRPVQWDLYNRLLRKEFDGLVIYKFDRWARSTKELIEHMESLIEKGVMVFSYTENIDLSSSMGRAMLTIISAFAQLERDIIRERTLAGLARARAQGKKLGRPRKGKEKPKPALDEVAKMHLEGISIRDIAKKLGTTKYWVEWSLKEMKDRPDKLGVSFRGEVFHGK
jgi:DNA invertase Pin-like site-specific DNA recombinase